MNTSAIVKTAPLLIAAIMGAIASQAITASTLHAQQPGAPEQYSYVSYIGGDTAAQRMKALEAQARDGWKLRTCISVDGAGDGLYIFAR